MKRLWAWLRSPSYVVRSRNDETGTEVRYNGRSIWVHINDQTKFDKHLIKLMKQVKR